MKFGDERRYLVALRYPLDLTVWKLSLFVLMRRNAQRTYPR